MQKKHQLQIRTKSSTYHTKLLCKDATADWKNAIISILRGKYESEFLTFEDETNDTIIIPIVNLLDAEYIFKGVNCERHIQGTETDK